MKTKPTIKVRQPSHDEISLRARERWLASGSPEGRDEEFWLSAERELQGTSGGNSQSLASAPGEGDRLQAKTEELLGNTDDGTGTRSASALNLT